MCERSLKTAKSIFFDINLETAEPENRETATNHSGKGACVYATYRDRSVCAVACSRDCITGSICLRFLFALRCCLNHSLFYPDFLTSEPENREKSSNSSGKEACVNAHRSTV